jgi:hypothetical protein
MAFLIIHAVGGAAIFALGMAAYRFALKRDPEALERLAAQAKALGERL